MSFVAVDTAEQLEELNLAGGPASPPSVHADANEQLQAPKAAKKKRKKRSTATDKAGGSVPSADANNVLISRSKHLKYISAYHGQWLHLPPGLVDLALEYNDEARVDYRKMLNEERRALTALLVEARGKKDKSTTERASAKAPARIDYGASTASAIGPSIAEYAASVGVRLPAPVDAAALRNVMEVRRLIEAAGDLIVRATSGMTAAELKQLNDPFEGGGGVLHSPPIANSTARSHTVSHVRQNRLRAMAVSHVAQAFRIDEIATSVVLMQSATAFDEIAQKVLRAEPGNVDAAYVMYYQERIPSRTLCHSTSPHILDPIIAATPLASGQLPALYRSRGVLHLYRQDFVAAIRDFTDGLRIVKLNTVRATTPRSESRPRGAGRKRGAARRVEASRSIGIEGDLLDEPDGDVFEVGVAAGDDIGRQLLFSRGMTYFLWASSAIEEAALGVCGLEVPVDGLSNEGGELGVEGAGFKLDNAARGLYDQRTAPAEAQRFREAFAPGTELRELVEARLRQAIRDHEHFQAHFPVFEAPPGSIFFDPKQEADDLASAARATAVDRSISFRGRRLIHARALTGRIQTSGPREDGLNPDYCLFTSYQPMLGESLFTQLLATLLLGDFERVLALHYRASRIMSGMDTIIDGRPFFLLGRSLSQSEYHEVFERLTNTWLADRSAGGLDLPQGVNENEIAAQGPLASLAHVASFFTVEHETTLYERYILSERESSNTRAANPEAQKILALLDGKPGAGKPAPPPRAYGVTPYTTARAEIALTWVRAACIAPLEAAEALRRPPASASSGSGVGGSGSGTASGSRGGKGKGKARAEN